MERIPTIKQLNEKYAGLLAQKKEAYRDYRKAKQDMTDFATAKHDIERFQKVTNEQELENQQVEERRRSREQAI